MIDGGDLEAAVEKFNSYKPVFRKEGKCAQEAELRTLVKKYEATEA